MKYLVYLFSALFLFTGIVACVDDETNTNYLSDYEAGEIKFDTTGMPNRLVLQYTLTPGDHIEFEPRVEYVHPERLRFRWFYLTLRNGSYQAQQVGNSLVYPPGDTIAYTQKLDWIVDLEPGTYRFYLMAEDTITGMRGYYQAQEQYTSVAVEGSQDGLYLLTDCNGETDIEILTSSLMLICGPDNQYLHYYSGLTGNMLPGSPKFIQGTHTGSTSKNGYLVCTDQNMYRIAQQNMVIMDEWDDMFYNTPEVYNPQCSFFMNNCDFLINDGKLHTLYTNRANSRKFSAPIAGDYTAYPFLMNASRTSWGAVSGAINADQVIYDQANKRFIPYYAYASSTGQFRTTNGDAYLDANQLPADPVVILNGGNYNTYCIMLLDGVYYLYRYNFYNRVDNGDLSADGEYSIINLSGCTDLANAKYWTSNSKGAAFYYATDKAMYSFSPSTGTATSTTVYECEPNEVITCIYTGGSVGGGWPTSSCILWIATWDESLQQGKIIEYEMDHDYGMPNSFWGPMFGVADNPKVTTGWGKIVDMTFLNAE